MKRVIAYTIAAESGSGQYHCGMKLSDTLKATFKTPLPNPLPRKGNKLGWLIKLC
jgi:hypothetical protein